MLMIITKHSKEDVTMAVVPYQEIDGCHGSLFLSELGRDMQVGYGSDMEWAYNLTLTWKATELVPYEG